MCFFGLRFWASRVSTDLCVCVGGVRGVYASLRREDLPLMLPKTTLDFQIIARPANMICYWSVSMRSLYSVSIEITITCVLWTSFIPPLDNLCRRTLYQPGNISLHKWLPARQCVARFLASARFVQSFSELWAVSGIVFTCTGIIALQPTMEPPSMIVRFLHSIPHVNITLHHVNSTFNPKSSVYIEVSVRHRGLATNISGFMSLMNGVCLCAAVYVWCSEDEGWR